MRPSASREAPSLFGCGSGGVRARPCISGCACTHARGAITRGLCLRTRVFNCARIVQLTNRLEPTGPSMAAEYHHRAGIVRLRAPPASGWTIVTGRTAPLHSAYPSAEPLVALAAVAAPSFGLLSPSSTASPRGPFVGYNVRPLSALERPSPGSPSPRAALLVARGRFVCHSVCSATRRADGPALPSMRWPAAGATNSA